MQPRKPEDFEEKIIFDRRTHKQSTHNLIVSNSVGTAIITLENNYINLPGTSSIEKQRKYQALHHDCVKALAETKEISQDTHRYIVAKLKEPLHRDFDYLTLFVPSSEGGYREEKFAMPLKEVIPLVWKALNDDAQYTHHYEGSEEEKLQSAEKDRPARLSGFYRCLDAMHTHQLCHHGDRNEVVFLLNKSYQGIELIEDGRAVILAFLKDWTLSKFDEKYTSCAPQEKTALARLLFQAIENRDASTLLDKLDPEKKWRDELYTLFRRHGTNPEIQLIQEMMTDALNYIVFSFDPKQHPLFQKISAILTGEETTKNPARDAAHQLIRQWIHSECDIEDEKDQGCISDFYRIDAARSELQKHERLLRASGEIPSEKIDEFKDNAALYFKAFGNSQTKIPAGSTALLEHIEPLTQAAYRAKKSALKDRIENFFFHWFSALAEQNIESSRALYAFFRDPSIRDKLILTDEQIQQSEKENTVEEDAETAYRDITPYEINRFFLHAILVDTAHWTPLFKNRLEEVLNLVKNLGQSENQNKLKRESYPPELLNQLGFLLAAYEWQHCTAENPLPQPQPVHRVIFLPEQVRTINDWHRITYWVSDETQPQKTKDTEEKTEEETPREAVYRICSATIILILSKNPDAGILISLLETIPKTKQIDFIKQAERLGIILKNVITSTNNLIAILKALAPENKFAFIDRLRDQGLDFKSLVKSARNLSFVIKILPIEHLVLFINTLPKLGLVFQDLVKSAGDLALVVSVLDPEHQIPFIYSLPDQDLNLKGLIKSRKDLADFLKHKAFQNKLLLIDSLSARGLVFKDLVKSADDLAYVVSVLATEDRLPFINGLRDRGLELKDLVNSARDLNNILANLAPEHKIPFIDSLPARGLVFKDLVKSARDLTWVICVLAPKHQIPFIDSLPALDLDLRKLLISFGDIHNLLKNLASGNQIAFIDKVRSLSINLEDPIRLCAILQGLVSENQIPFIDSLPAGNWDLKKIVKSGEGLADILTSIDSKHRIAFIEKTRFPAKLLNEALSLAPKTKHSSVIKKALSQANSTQAPLLTEEPITTIRFSIFLHVNELHEAKDDTYDLASAENNLEILEGLAKTLALHVKAVPELQLRIIKAYQQFKFALINKLDTQESITGLIKETTALADSFQVTHSQRRWFFQPQEDPVASQLKAIIKIFEEQTQPASKRDNRR